MNSNIFHAGTKVLAERTGEAEFTIHKILDQLDAAQRIWLIKLINKAWEQGVEQGKRETNAQKN